MELTPVQIGCLMILLLFVFMYFKMPIGASMLVVGLLGFIMVRGISAGLSSLGIIAWRQGLKDILLLIPTFTWMGMLASRGGISGGAFASIYRWVGHLPGGLAMASTGACSAFGAVCGNQMATALTMSAVALPEMRKYKYNDAFSLASIAAAGNLGIMIPPSGSFVLFGFLTETSIGALFIAGILPGILITIMFWMQMYIQCKMNPSLGPQGPRFGWIERLKSLKGLWTIVFVFVLVIGGIYTGIFTPGEAAACGAAAVLIVSLISRQLTWKAFVDSLRETLGISSMIMLILVGAMYFGAFVAVSQIPNALVDFITALSINRWAVMGIILLIYIICGFVMDVYSILVITVPILFPVVQALGFDALHFGVLCILTIMLGGITPPFGGVVFVLAGMNREVPLTAIFRQCWPFVTTMLIALIVILFVPGISTFLPDFMIPYR